MTDARFADTLENLVSSLGTGRDKAVASRYVERHLDDAQLLAAYRSAWMARKIIEVPALDATRKWRAWKASQEQITLIEAEEQRLGVQEKVRDALTKARLWGGAAIIIGVPGAPPSEPLDPSTLGEAGLSYLTVLTRRQLVVEQLDDDPASATFMLPRYYRIAVGGSQPLVHASRVARFIGAAPADPELQAGQYYGYGDPVLLSIYDALMNADATTANIASMVFEGKVDVVKIPDFMASLGDDQYREQVLRRIQLAMTAKGINGSLLLDAAEEYQPKQLSFAALADLMMTFYQVVAGAADIPITRLLGQSPGGLQASGENEIRNYYDRIAAHQSLEITPALRTLDECLIRSATGQRDPSIWYEWAGLWQTKDKERAEIGQITATIIRTLHDTELIPPDVLSRVAVNALAETGTLPGIDSADAAEEIDAGIGLADAEPTEAMREEARRGLEWRREYGRGGTEVGVARARDIAAGRNLSPETIARMVSYFARHEGDRRGQGWSPGQPGYPSAGRIAWALWGGDPGRAWATARWREIQRERRR